MITEKRADGKVETEATIKVWVEGRRYVRTAEGNGPVNALDKALRSAITELHPAPRRHRADQLQGADPRRGPRHRRGHPGAARLLRRARRLGHDRRLREHHRGVLGGAGRVARIRVPAATGATTACGRPDEIPLARPELGEREEELVLEVLRSGRLSLGPWLERFEREFAAWLGRRRRRRGLLRHGRAPPRRARARLGRRATRSSTSPFSFVASANCLSTRARRPSSATSTRSRSTSTRMRPRRRSGSATAGLLPVRHPRLPGGRCRRSSRDRLRRAASASSRTPARRWARSTPTGVRVGAQGITATFAFYANKQLTTGEGGMIVPADAEAAARFAASATRAGRRTWAGSTTSGSASTTG